MKLLTITALLLFSSSSFSSDYKLEREQCSNVDIRTKQTKAVKEHLSKPSDQGTMGWCYGYAAAELLSVEAGEPVSPTHVSSIFNKSIRSNIFWRIGYGIQNLFRGSKKETYEGGFIGKATVEAMEDSPLCRYNISDVYPYVMTRLEFVKGMLKTEDISEKEACNLIKEVLPNLNVSDEDFIKKFVTKNLNDTLESMHRENCETVEVPKRKKKSLRRPVFWGKKKYVSNVNKLLDAGKPLGVSYNVKHVTHMKGMHASTVIGRRWKNGRCEYNIKNSWGRFCNYKPGIECNRTDGSFWVKDEDFFKLAFNLDYLE